MMALEFKPVDLNRHADVCLRFAEDTEVCSFGSVDGFREKDGKGARRFIEKIRTKLEKDPESCLHIWQGEEIIGQLHLGHFLNEAIGYIHFFYVAPVWRGRGVASAMEEYAVAHFKQRGFEVTRLSVSTANIRAVRFYLRQGWMDLGPRPDKPDVHNMEKSCG